MKISPFRLETSRLIIRPSRLGDASALFRLIRANREALADYFPMTVSSTASVMATRAYLLRRTGERKAGTNLFAGIFLRESGQLIGQLQLKDINWRVPKGDAGYFIDSAHAGNGLGSEAMQAFTKYCFENPGMVKVSLRIEPKNMASKRVAEKCGFVCIGVMKNDFRGADGRLMDCELWEKIK